MVAILATDLGESFAKEQLKNAVSHGNTARMQALVAPNLLAMLYRQRKVRLDEQEKIWRDSNSFDEYSTLNKAQIDHESRIKQLHKARLKLLVSAGSTSWDSDAESDLSPVLIFKVFFSALQVLSLANRFEFTWPGFLKTVFVIQSSATGGNSFSLDCFFPNRIPVIYERVLLFVSVRLMFRSIMQLWVIRFVCLLCSL